MLLHVNMGRDGRAAMPQRALDIVQATLLLRQRCDASPNHREGQLRQFQFPCQSVPHSPTGVTRIHEPVFRVRKMNAPGEGSGESCFHIGQFFRNGKSSAGRIWFFPRDESCLDMPLPSLGRHTLCLRVVVGWRDGDGMDIAAFKAQYTASRLP